MSEDVKPYGASSPPANEPTPDELRALIARTGLSQRRAAEAIDISERMMRYYASGQEKIPRAVLYALRYLASQVSGASSDYRQDLPDDEIYLISDPLPQLSALDGDVVVCRRAAKSTAHARVVLTERKQAGKDSVVWRARRVLLGP